MSFSEEGHQRQRDVVCRGKVSDRLLKELRVMLCRHIGRNGGTEGVWLEKQGGARSQRCHMSILRRALCDTRQGAIILTLLES